MSPIPPIMSELNSSPVQLSTLLAEPENPVAPTIEIKRLTDLEEGKITLLYGHEQEWGYGQIASHIGPRKSTI